MATPDEPWTIGRLLSWTVDYLQRHGAENPRLDAEVLLAAARGCRRIDLYAAYGEEAGEATRTAFRGSFVGGRQDACSYLVGHREFYAARISSHVGRTHSRPERSYWWWRLLDHETAAEDQRWHCRRWYGVRRVGGVCGEIRAQFAVTAIDISPAALAVARRNAEKHGVSGRIEFVESDLFQSVPPDASFDYVVSNPPYVSTAEMSQLAADVRQHEPHVALSAGEQGTSVIAPLIGQAAERLRPGGVLLIEISPMIAEKVEQLVRGNSALELLPTLRDLGGLARVVQAHRTSAE
jgi:release factor glutamine methyltransferase